MMLGPCCHPLKCELVGRGPDGGPVPNDHNIRVDGVQLTPVEHDRPIRYLGLHVAFNGSCVEQQNRSRRLIMKFTRLAIKYHLTLRDTVYMFNTFLVTRLELALHYTHGPGTTEWVQECDRLLIGCIRHIAKSPLRLSHSAVALTLHLILPSWLETSIKVSELFFRMNSTDGRWGELGRIILRREGLATIDAATSLPQRNGPSRTGRAAYLARTRLQWHMFLRRRSEGRRDHIFDTPPHIGVPPHGSTEASSNAIVSLTEAPVVIVHDLWHGWDTDAAATRLRDPIDVYTDGTFDPASAKSAWSVVLGDRWLDNNFGTIPADERLVLPSHVAGATLYGAHIVHTRHLPGGAPGHCPGAGDVPAPRSPPHPLRQPGVAEGDLDIQRRDQGASPMSHVGSPAARADPPPRPASTRSRWQRRVLARPSTLG